MCVIQPSVQRLVCMNNQKERPGCYRYMYVKSPTAQDVFLPIPGCMTVASQSLDNAVAQWKYLQVRTYHALFHFSMLQATESWAAPGNKARHMTSNPCVSGACSWASLNKIALFHVRRLDHAKNTSGLNSSLNRLVLWVHELVRVV